MNLFSQRRPCHARDSRRARRVAGQCAASVLVALLLGACAQHGLDDVKPTATTAYRTAQPSGSAPPAAHQP